MAAFEAPVPLLPEILALHGKWRADKPAVVFEADTWSWATFTGETHAFAHGLLAAGVQPGDRVGVVMSNGLAMVQVLFGCMAAGAVSVPLNLSVNDEAVVAMLSDAGVTAIAVTSDQAPRVEGLLDQLPGQAPLLLCDQARPGWTSIGALSTGCATGLPEIAIDPDTPLNIIYSSGTTGLPKGIVHTQRGRRDWAYDLAIALRYHGGAKTLLTIGLYSNISWVAMLCTLLAGGTIVLERHFDAARFLEQVESLGITHTAMVPIQFQRVLERQAQQPRRLHSMQAMMSCGSPLHEGLKRQVFEHFPCGIVELYGLTEGIITTLEPEEAEGRWASVGRPLIGTDIAIIDDEGHVCPPGDSGEIVSRGRITMPGYWQRDDANDEARYIDAGGREWLRSGDIGYLDKQGYLFIVDRKKDMILSGGQNIYPQDIEALLVQHPTVADVAVIGAPSERWGETPVALVVAAEGAPDAGELLAWANERLGRQQRLTDLRLVDSLPRNPNGKILKRVLRQDWGDLRYG